MPLSRTEYLARKLFKHYLPFLKVQYGIRPDWLKWPVTGNNLELDIYFPEIKVAVEVDGIQHGRPIVGMQKDFAAFEKQQARDIWKLHRCQDLGITLYKLTVFDLTRMSFHGWMEHFSYRHLGKGIHWSITPPDYLFAEAEKLSRQRFRPANAVKKPKPAFSVSSVACSGNAGPPNPPHSPRPGTHGGMPISVPHTVGAGSGVGAGVVGGVGVGSGVCVGVGVDVGTVVGGGVAIGVCFGVAVGESRLETPVGSSSQKLSDSTMRETASTIACMRDTSDTVQASAGAPSQSSHCWFFGSGVELASSSWALSTGTRRHPSTPRTPLARAMTAAAVRSMGMGPMPKNWRTLRIATRALAGPFIRRQRRRRGCRVSRREGGRGTRRVNWLASASIASNRTGSLRASMMWRPLT